MYGDWSQLSNLRFIVKTKTEISSLIKNIKQTAVINIMKNRTLLTWRFVCYATYIFKSMTLACETARPYKFANPNSDSWDTYT